MKKLIYLFVMAMLMSGCAINAPSYRSTEGLDAKQGLILVEYFDMTHAENLYKGKSDFSKITAEYLAGALQERNFTAVTVERQSTKLSGKYRITGEITKIDQGSWQGRFWVAPGVGMPCISAQAVLIRVSDNKELARVKETTFSTTLQGTESILRRVCAKLSRNIVDKLYDALRNDMK